MLTGQKLSLKIDSAGKCRRVQKTRKVQVIGLKSKYFNDEKINALLSIVRTVYKTNTRFLGVRAYRCLYGLPTMLYRSLGTVWKLETT